MPDDNFVPGVVPALPNPKDFVLGELSALPREIVLPGGNWRPFKSEPHEMQQRLLNNLSIAFPACTDFAATDVVEALEFKKFGVRKNYCDRALAILSELTPFGNSLWAVAEAIRTFGLVPEEMLPWTAEQDTLAKYLFITPEKRAEVIAAGKAWLQEFDFGYEFVYDDFGLGMKAALEYSPIFAAALYASEAGKDANGIYHTDLPHSPMTTHAFALLSIEDDGTKYIDDSFATQEKHLAADFRVPIGMRFHLAKKTNPDPMLYYPPKNSYVSVADTGERLGYIGGETIIKFASNGDALAEMMKRNGRDGLSPVQFPMVDVKAADIAHLKRVDPKGNPI